MIAIHIFIIILLHDISHNMSDHKQKLDGKSVVEFNKAFTEFYGYPIEIFHENLFHLYMKKIEVCFPEILENYNEMFNFVNAEFDGNVFKFNNYVDNVMHDMKNRLLNKPEFKNFLKENRAYKGGMNEKPESKLPSEQQIDRNLYVVQNTLPDCNTFIRLDIIKANFSMISLYYPQIFADPRDPQQNPQDPQDPQQKPRVTWEQFVSQFTRYPIVAKSKKRREVLFGKLASGKQCLFYTNAILTDINETIGVKPKIWIGDEIVYAFDPVHYHDLNKYIREKYDGIVRIECFTLHSIFTKIDPVFVEKFFSVDNNGEVIDPCIATKLRMCAKKYVMQVVATIFNKPLDKHDMLFVDNGIISMFMDTIVYNCENPTGGIE